MSDKPTVLRVNDLMEDVWPVRLDPDQAQYGAVATAMRRLHAENEALRDENKVLEASCEAKADRIDRLGESVERDTALLRQALEALSQAVKLANATGWSGGPKTISTIAALRKRLGDKG